MNQPSMFPKPTGDRPNPAVLLCCDDPASPEAAQLEIACGYYGLDLHTAAPAGALETCTNRQTQLVLVAIDAATLSNAPAGLWPALRDFAHARNLPLAVVGIGAGHEVAVRAATGLALEVQPTPTGSQAGLWVEATEPSETGYELRNVRLALGPGPVSRLVPADPAAVHTLARAGLDEAEARPVFLRIRNPATPVSLIARTAPAAAASAWIFQPQFFAELAPVFMLVREAGGERCWQPAERLANLTIDDPWLTEPYGSLSYRGLLKEMQAERFHATIGHIPWNYRRYKAGVVALFRDNPANFSLAVHGNNHDRYEFFRYAARTGDQQHPKPKEVQAFNIRQAMARMETFEKNSGLPFGRVMVFPHGICPGPSIELLKHAGFLATFNYHNVPLDEKPPANPAYALRSVYTQWFGFPTFRRNYPHNYVEPLIAIDLFLGNPTLFMAHQDTFFEGIDAFTPVARSVNTRQPATVWAGLGEIARRHHLVRWPAAAVCEVRLLARTAEVKNPKPHPVVFHFSKHEPQPTEVARIASNGADLAWTSDATDLHFSLQLPPGGTALVEIQYKTNHTTPPVPLQRTGLRNFALRGIADFRDLILPRSFLGRLLTQKYYRPGKKRPTLGGMLANTLGALRRR